MRKGLLTVLLALLGAFLSPVFSLAHDFTVLAYVDADTVYTETYFFDGKAVPNGHVDVVDSHSNIVAQGRTNENGLFAFAPSVQDDLTIVVREMLGHRNTCTIKKDQLIF